MWTRLGCTSMLSAFHITILTLGWWRPNSHESEEGWLAGQVDIQPVPEGHHLSCKSFYSPGSWTASWSCHLGIQFSWMVSLGPGSYFCWRIGKELIKNDVTPKCPLPPLLYLLHFTLMPCGQCQEACSAQEIFLKLCKDDGISPLPFCLPSD